MESNSTQNLVINKEVDTIDNQRQCLNDLLKRRFFLAPSFDIYGGVAGLYDFGPAGCAIKNNLEQLWREHFILEEQMCELNTTCLTPLKVLQASGHVERFCDLMVKDKVNGNVVRADKYLVEWIENLLDDDKILKSGGKLKDKKKAKVQPMTDEQVRELQQTLVDAESFKGDDMDKVFKKLQIKSKDGNDFEAPQEFNLMFGTQIGPTGDNRGFLRPELAQGIFMNFNKLLDYNGGKLPFAGACIGLGFRNEIAPRGGLIRVREFQMAEIEHFVDPQNKKHEKFEDVQDLVIPLFSQERQETLSQPINDMTLREAIDKNIIDNTSLAYFMGRTFLFLKKAGVNPNNIRFRQHMKNEMAHYAKDCWDAEIETSSGWIECVGHADRSAYDLSAHSKASKTNMEAARRLPQPIQKQFTIITLDKKMVGIQFKADQRVVSDYIENMDESIKESMINHFQSNDSDFIVNIDGKGFNIQKQMVTKTESTVQTIQEEKFVPSVIEPSFGVGRILSCIFEHSFRMRDEKRTYLSLPARMAPVKSSILTVVNGPEYQPIIKYLRQNLTQMGISNKLDDGGQSIGKRYARTDEIAIPFAITIDKETLTAYEQNNKQFDNQNISVTMREINTMKQIRLPIDQVSGNIKQIVDGFKTWEDLCNEYPAFEAEKEEEQ